MSGPRPSAPTVKRLCRICDSEFTVLERVIRQGRGVHCSRPCANRAMKERTIESSVRTVVQCPCGATFTVVPSTVQLSRGKYCSVACSKTYRRKQLPGGQPPLSNEPTVAAVKFKRVKSPAKQATSITPKRDDAPLLDGGSHVTCHRCLSLRERGIRCTCERWEP